MAAMSKRGRAQQVVLVVLGLGAVVTNAYALVTYFLAGPRPTGGAAAPPFSAILAAPGPFPAHAAPHPPPYRRGIADAPRAPAAPTASMAGRARQRPPPSPA